MIATIIVRELGWISEQSVKTSSDGKLCLPCVLFNKDLEIARFITLYTY